MLQRVFSPEQDDGKLAAAAMEPERKQQEKLDAWKQHQEKLYLQQKQELQKEQELLEAKRVQALEELKQRLAAHEQAQTVCLSKNVNVFSSSMRSPEDSI